MIQKTINNFEVDIFILTYGDLVKGTGVLILLFIFSFLRMKKNEQDAEETINYLEAEIPKIIETNNQLALEDRSIYDQLINILDWKRKNTESFDKSREKEETTRDLLIQDQQLLFKNLKKISTDLKTPSSTLDQTTLSKLQSQKNSMNDIWEMRANTFNSLEEKRLKNFTDYLQEKKKALYRFLL